MTICRMLFLQASVFFFVVTWATVNCGPDKVKNLLIKYDAGHRALMVMRTVGHPSLPSCILFTDENMIDKFPKESVTEILYIKNEMEFQKLAVICDNSIPLIQRRYIQQGTKWCGAGNIAKNYDDLGSHIKTDMCCRDHDHCDDFIAAGETKHNLTNNSLFTVSSCRCDKQFYDCLNNSNEMVSFLTMSAFFLNMDCFTADIPERCQSYKTSEGNGIQCSEENPVYRFVNNIDYVEGKN